MPPCSPRALGHVLPPSLSPWPARSRPSRGCASGPEKVAFENKVFYQYDTLNPAQAAKSLEAHYPPLDKTEAPPLPEYTGVSVLEDAVHISRPRDWVIRAGSAQAEHRYIEYVSPNEYMVAVYELVESPARRRGAR